MRWRFGRRNRKDLGRGTRVIGHDDERRRAVAFQVEPDAPQALEGDVKGDPAVRPHEEAPISHQDDCLGRMGGRPEDFTRLQDSLGGPGYFRVIPAAGVDHHLPPGACLIGRFNWLGAA